MSSEIAIKVEKLSKCYPIYEQPRDRLKQFILPRLRRLAGQASKRYYREFWALSDLSFEVRKGETVGIIGRNGSGKSTLLQLICGTLNPTAGTIRTSGRIAALLELGSGFNPEFTGRENVYLNAAILGLANDEIDARFADIAAFADIGEFIERPVRTYSSGMMVRLAFAVAINVAPEVLIIDEALAVGDAAFQRKCMRKIEELSRNGVTLLFVSHDMETVRKICNEAIYLKHGKLIETGPAKSVCIEYERDLFGASTGAEGPPVLDHLSADNESPPLMDPDLIVCNEQLYGDGRAQILDISLTDNRQQKLNVAEIGAQLVVSYRVLFLDAVAQPVLGMMVSNREGVCIFGTNTDGLAISNRSYAIGDEVQITFNLTNNLGPGIYYLTCGIYSTDSDGNLIYLQRRMDALIFKSVLRTNERIAGIAYLYPKIESLILESVK